MQVMARRLYGPPRSWRNGTYLNFATTTRPHSGLARKNPCRTKPAGASAFIRNTALMKKGLRAVSLLMTCRPEIRPRWDVRKLKPIYGKPSPKIRWELLISNIGRSPPLRYLPQCRGASSIAKAPTKGAFSRPRRQNSREHFERRRELWT